MTSSATNASTLPGFDLGGLLEMMLSLALVVGLIVALAWLIGRLRGVTRSTSGAISVLAEIAIGPKERIVLVRVGDRQALLGVSSAGVTSLELLEHTITVPEAPAVPSFALKLKDVMKHAGISK